MPGRQGESPQTSGRRTRQSSSRATSSSATDPNIPSASEADPDEDDEDDHEEEEEEQGNGEHAGSFIKTNLNREDMIKSQRSHQELRAKVQEARDEDAQTYLTTLEDALKSSNKIFKGDVDVEKVRRDAETIHILSKGGVELTKRLQTGSDKFKTNEFIEKLITVINDESRMQTQRRGRDRGAITADAWIEFGKKFGHILNSAPRFEYLYGTFEPEAIELARRKVVQRSRINYKELKQTQAEKVDPNENKHDDTTNKHVQEMFRQLKKLSDKNKVDRLPFYQCLVDPRSFSQTVENIFHSSFLLKEGLIRIEPDEDGDPDIIPVKDPKQMGFSPSKRQTAPARQSVLSFSMKDYKKWIEEYEIEVPLLKQRRDKNATSPSKPS